MTKKTIKKVKVGVEKPKEEPKKVTIRRFGIFDHGGKHFIRCYSTEDFPNAKEIAEGFISKEAKPTQRKQERDEPKKIRTIIELTKEELAEWEDVKRLEDIAIEAERYRKAVGNPRSIVHGKEGEISTK